MIAALSLVALALCAWSAVSSIRTNRLHRRYLRTFDADRRRIVRRYQAELDAQRPILAAYGYGIDEAGRVVDRLPRWK